MKKKMKRILAVMLTLILLMTSGVVPVSAGTLTISVTGKYGQSAARGMLKGVNQFRTGNEAWVWNPDNATRTVYRDLKPLTYDYQLERTAMQRAIEIALSFGHTRPNGQICFTAYEADYEMHGENIAAGTGPYGTAESTLDSWKEMNEPYEGQGHRRAMLNPSFKAIGIGHVYYNGCHYWVQEFSSRNSGKAKTTAVNEAKKVTIEVDTSFIRSISVRTDTSSYTIGQGKTASLPKVNAQISVVNQWPGDTMCSVEANLKWKVSDTSVAVVSDGKLKGKKGGKTTLTGTAMGKTIRIPVTVIAAPKVPKLKKISDVDKKYLKLTWSSVSGADGYYVYRLVNGEWEKLKTLPGKSTVSYTDKTVKTGVKYTYRVCAYKKFGSSVLKSDYQKSGNSRIAGLSLLKLNKTTLVLKKGSSSTLKLKGTSLKPVWKTGKSSVAVVSANGKVTAVKAGTTTITAKLGGKKYTCRVIVK